jgi:hypothetical protein
MVLVLGARSAAAQMAERPMPAVRPVGIIYPSAMGSMTGNSLKQDQLTEAAIAEVEQSLRQLGYQVLPRSDVVLKLNDSGIQCPSGVYNCAPIDVLKTLNLGAVVLVAIWWNRSPADITIEVTTPDAVGSAKGTLKEDVRRTVPALVTSALQDLQNGKAVELQIKSLPIGAEVRLDGELIGTAPLSAKARPGPHEVVLRYPEYVTTSHHFEVARAARSPLLVDVAMERAGATAARRATMNDPSRDSNSKLPTWDYLLGAALGIAGVAVLVAPIDTLSRDSDCGAMTNKVGCERVHFGARSGLQVAGGVLALSGAVVLFVATPIRASLSTNGEGLHAQINGSF